jgi:hypothetical protein
MADQLDDFSGPFWEFWGPCFKEPIVEMELRDDLDYDLLHQRTLDIACQGKVVGSTSDKKSTKGEIIGFEDRCPCGMVLGNIDYFTENLVPETSGVVKIVYRCPGCKKYPHITH